MNMSNADRLTEILTANIIRRARQLSALDVDVLRAAGFSLKSLTVLDNELEEFGEVLDRISAPDGLTVNERADGMEPHPSPLHASLGAFIPNAEYQPRS
jgi:hypothetical protein